MSHSPYTPSKDLKKTIIRCPYSKCHARIIKPTNQSIQKFQLSQNFLKINELTDTINDDEFLRVEDAWDFDNIGVSKEVPNKEEEKDDDDIERLIVCADCERGPLGFAKFDKDDIKDVKNLKFYLHLNSCLYQDV